jgi:membrane-associated phospholipid phosphatase
MVKRWSDLVHDKYQVYEFIFALLATSSFLVIAPPFLKAIEARKGMICKDYFIDFLPRYDVSIWIVLILYTSLIISFVWLISRPKLLTVALKAMFLTNSIRYIFIYLIPLEPPIGLLPLDDPLLDEFIYKSRFITKDLFYSGHMANASLLFLCVGDRRLKVFLGLAVVLIGILLLVQRVHYSYDVLFAPLATYACYKLSQYDWFVKRDLCLITR